MPCKDQEGGKARRRFLISTKELLSPLTSQRAPPHPHRPPAGHARADVGALAPVGHAGETSGNSLQSSVWQIKPYKRPRKHI